MSFGFLREITGARGPAEANVTNIFSATTNPTGGKDYKQEKTIIEEESKLGVLESLSKDYRKQQTTLAQELKLQREERQQTNKALSYSKGIDGFNDFLSATRAVSYTHLTLPTILRV